MTKVLITVDTELSVSRARHGIEKNLASSVFGKCRAGDFGIGWQMDQLEAFGLKGVFFVDPIPSLVHGDEMIKRIVDPISSRGHEVQLHLHPEWLTDKAGSPVDGRVGRNISDFSRADQATLLHTACSIFERLGVAKPAAFRAGNYGCDDTTLGVLANIGIRYDSSLNTDFLDTSCKISLGGDQILPVRVKGVVEVPVSGIEDRPGHFRPAQVCALSVREMREALRHAGREHHPTFVIVTHSFEMLSRDRQRPNRNVMSRFVSMCREIANNPQLQSSGFKDLDEGILEPLGHPVTRLAPHAVRTSLRIAEQALSNWIYERQLRPAWRAITQ